MSSQVIDQQTGCQEHKHLNDGERYLPAVISLHGWDILKDCQDTNYKFAHFITFF